MGLRRVPPEIKAEAHFPGRGFDTRQFHQFSSFKQQKDKNMILLAILLKAILNSNKH